MHLSTFALFAGLCVFAGPAIAAEAVTDCDRLAASPNDPKHVAPAVDDDHIQGKAAETACRKALKASPDVARYSYQLGRALEAEERYDAAMAAYQAAFDKGYAAAADAEGMLFEYGLGREVDYDKAAELYQRALETGDLFAAGDLGSMHEAGESFDKSAAAAVPLYRKAAEAGYAVSQVNLGYLLEHGDGVKENVKEAVDWYRKAADQGFSVGQFDLALMYGEGAGIEKSLKDAIRLLTLASDQDYGLATLELARYARDGTGMAVDEAKAEKLFRQAIDSGDDDAVWQARSELALMWTSDEKKLGEAAALAAQALEGVPDAGEDRSTVLDTVAWIAHLQHDDAKALPLEQEAVKGDAKYAPYHDHLGDMLLALGRKPEAGTEWKNALRLDPPDPGDGWDRAAVIKKLAALQPASTEEPVGSDPTGPTISPIR